MAHDFRTVKAKIVTGAPEAGPFREAWAHMRRPHVAAFWHLRSWWLLHRGMVRARRWWIPVRGIALITVLWAATALLVAWVVWGAWGISNPGSGRTADEVCKDSGVACGAITGVVVPLLAAAAAAVLFLAWRLWRVRRFYVHRAMSEPSRLVRAGSLTNDVVGRDQLCNAIMNDLRDRSARRPHVVVGKVGAGKTALLVRMTQRLAAKGAVPVPIQLRDADKNLDFCRLARARFFEIAGAKARSEAELDRIWQWLLQQADRIVVLADGLEDFLDNPHDDPEAQGERDNLIRDAIRKAGEDGLPLVIASRPHAPLRAMQAAITDLEPLSHEASLRFVAQAGGWRSNHTILDRVVEGANVAESPLYLQIARDLHRGNLLEPLWRESGAADLRVQDLWALREDLMDAWLDALLSGDVSPELPIDKDTREAAVEYISALACIGLMTDRSEVSMRELEDPGGRTRSAGRANGHSPDGQRSPSSGSGGPWLGCIAAELQTRLTSLRAPNPPNPPNRTGGQGAAPETSGLRMDPRLAATWCTRMGLVHEQGDSVLFQHSIMQAYLGSRFLPSVVRPSSSNGPAGRARQARERAHAVSVGVGARRVRPAHTRVAQAERAVRRAPTGHIAQALSVGGRELLIALTLYSRSLEGRCICRNSADEKPECPISTLRSQLKEEALNLLDRAEHAWPPPSAYRCDPGTAAADQRDGRGSPHLRALEILGTAVEIDSVHAYADQPELVSTIKGKWQHFGQEEDLDQLREAKLALVKQCGSASRRVAAAHHGKSAYADLFEIGRCEPDYRVRVAIAQEIGAGSEPAYGQLGNDLRRPSWAGRQNEETGSGTQHGPSPGAFGDPALDDQREKRFRRQQKEKSQLRNEEWTAQREVQEDKEAWYAQEMGAWVLPMLVESSHMTRHLGSPHDDLERWVNEVSDQGTHAFGWEDGKPAPIPRPGEKAYLGLALACGFKYAANRRFDAGVEPESRAFLIKQAQDLLKQSTNWFTRLTLLQALTLWALPDDVSADRPIRGSKSHPKDQVQEWLALERGRKEHPLVKAGARLAVRALQTRRPERFLWIDEASVAADVGTEVSTPGEQRFHNLWIPPSTGWSTLDPLAQQLLGDILLLIVLAERDYRPKDLFTLMERRATRPQSLPSCLSKDRVRLSPVRAVERGPQPGENCTDDCRMKLCPYPAKAENLRTEFSEVFCMRQRDLLRRWQPRSWLYLRFRREAFWQHGVPVAGMRRFWSQMGDRARDVRPEEAAASSNGEDH